MRIEGVPHWKRHPEESLPAYTPVAVQAVGPVFEPGLHVTGMPLELATARHDLGATSGLDVAQQQALLDSTLTQVDVLRRTRGQFEHAIAALTGTPAPLFSLAPDIRLLVPPPVPLGVPSDILQRRPDVAAAELAGVLAP